MSDTTLDEILAAAPVTEDAPAASDGEALTGVAAGVLASANAVIAKARMFGPEEAPAPNAARLPEEQQGSFIAAGAIMPPYDPLTLSIIVEHASALRPYIESLITNVDGFGFRMEPSLHLTGDDAYERIEEAILLERMADHGPSADVDVTVDDVQGRYKSVEREARLEKLHAELFFRYCNTDGGSFVELREKVRRDVEDTGNGYIEVIRNRAGQPAQLGYLPSITCRLMRADLEYVDVEVPQKVSALAYRQTMVKRRFRRMVQIVFGVSKAFFKEFGDPRTMSATTGNYYDSVDALRESEGPDAIEAHEYLHLKIHSPRSVYGIPRWTGALLAVLGTRAAEEVNYMYFDNKAVPPLAVLVSGGTLASDAVDRLQNYLETELRGRDNFHSILLLEAESSSSPGQIGTPGRVRMELKPLRDAQQDDALFLSYQEKNALAAGAAYRIPKILIGQTDSINRATADAALLYAEMQVFNPERQRFDHLINTRLFAEMGIKYWTFVSNSPVMKDPQTLSSMVASLVGCGVLTPRDGRLIAEDIFNRPWPRIDHWWQDQPIALTQAQITPESTATQPAPNAGGDAAVLGQPPLSPEPLAASPDNPNEPLATAFARLRDEIQARTENREHVVERLRTEIQTRAATSPQLAQALADLQRRVEAMRTNQGVAKSDEEYLADLRDRAAAEGRTVEVLKVPSALWSQIVVPDPAPPDATS